MPTNDLNRVNAYFSSSNHIAVTNPDTVKLLLFQDVEDIKFEDMCDDDAPQLDIVTLRAIAALQSGLDFSKESISTDIILTLINSITSQAITPAEQALGKFTRCKLKNMNTWNDWEAGEHKQLNQFHNLQIFGKIWCVLSKKTLLYFDHIGSIMSKEMGNKELDNVAMVPNEQLQYYMHLRKPIPLASNILFNVNSLHLQPDRIFIYLEAMLKMLLLILWLLKSLHL